MTKLNMHGMGMKEHSGSPFDRDITLPVPQEINSAILEHFQPSGESDAVRAAATHAASGGKVRAVSTVLIISASHFFQPGVPLLRLYALVRVSARWRVRVNSLWRLPRRSRCRRL